MSAELLSNVSLDLKTADSQAGSGILPTAVKDAPPWMLSLLVHGSILGALALIVPAVTQEMKPPQMISSVIEEAAPLEQEPEYRFDMANVEQLGDSTESGGIGPSLAAASVAAPAQLPRVQQQRVSQQIAERLPEISIQGGTPVPVPAEAFLTTTVATQGMTEHAGGVEGAIDRITFEIASSLKERKTLVVWLFDVSQSLTARREAIADRFENVYKQLGLLKAGGEGALLTAVASYGGDTQYLTEQPVDNFQKAVEKVRAIKSDASSSQENVFASVTQVISKWKSYSRGHNVMVIVVTDERGDDFNRLEDAIQVARNSGARVYCVANEAPFGREFGYVRWTYDDGFSEFLPVDQGPESAALEQLPLGFWGTRGAPSRMTSGFGPYALTRLCRETHGVFFVADRSDGDQFDPLLMRAYQPDYVPIAEYQKKVSENLAKMALVTAAKAASVEEIPEPRTYFTAENDATLREQLTEAQKPMAVVDHQLVRMFQALATGEKDRGRLTEPRWRAGFDLAVGRVLAMRVRAYGYNVTLANMQISPKRFEKPGNNAWQLRPTDEVDANANVRQWQEQAVASLNRVVNDHPGTPWAAIAQQELSTPMGWKWVETFDRFADLRRRAAMNDPEARLMLAEEERRIQQLQPPAQGRPRPNL